MGPHETRKRALAPADSVILPSRTLRPGQRVGIYVDAYMARLVEALEDDFPAVARLVAASAVVRCSPSVLASSQCSPMIERPASSACFRISTRVCCETCPIRAARVNGATSIPV